MNSRENALENIISILEEKKKLHLVLKASCDGMDDPREKSFVSRLSRGCVERKITLDNMIEDLSSVKLKKMRPVIRNILRMGLYQIFFMDSVTDFAACDESVKLAGKKGFASLKGFVNGILRNACRNKEKIQTNIEMDPVLKYSMPQWLVDTFSDSFGKRGAEAAFEYFFDENPLSVRLNISKCDPEGFLEKAGDKFGKKGYVDYCFEIKEPGDIEEIEGFKEGLFTVQDFSSILTGYLADRVYKGISKAEKDTGNSCIPKVLDLCAAPGGKSLHLLDLGYDVRSCDISERKLALIKEAADRIGFGNIKIQKNDALVFNEDFENKYDLVLCDLPCSGLGVIGRKPDLKYIVTPETSTELSSMQKNILKNAVRYVKTGGILIYSTCTIRKCENEDNADFLAAEPGIKRVSVEEYLPDGIRPARKEDNFILIRPGEYGSDGFFISCFVKV